MTIKSALVNLPILLSLGLSRRFFQALIFTTPILVSIIAVPAKAGSLLGDINCGLNSLLGGNCSEIERINEYQEKKQAEWLAGSITGVQMVKSIVEFHKSLTPIDRYNKELYLYYFQVAQACDAGKISKKQGLYLMAKKDNEVQERINAGQPPPSHSFTCASETFAGTTTTKCQ